MNNFKAVTATGTTYTYNGHTIRVESARSGTSVFMPWTTAEFSEDDAIASDLGMWAFLKTQPRIGDLPTVGKRMYFGGKDEWKISTVVMSVEALDEA